MATPEATYPRRINPNKVVDCTIEVRFESQVPPEIVLALIFSQVHDKWGSGNATLISQLPKQLRELQPELKYQPTHEWKKDGFRLLVGSSMIGFGADQLESGEKFVADFENAIASWDLPKIFGRVTRLGLRYINLFEELNVYEKSTLKIELPGDDLVYSSTLLRSELDRGKFRCNLQVLHPANVEKEGRKRMGSVVDIDVSTKPTTAVPPQAGAIATHLREMHKVADALFFSVLTKEYVATLNPEY